jgi:hypothetical protein
MDAFLASNFANGWFDGVGSIVESVTSPALFVEREKYFMEIISQESEGDGNGFGTKSSCYYYTTSLQCTCEWF